MNLQIKINKKIVTVNFSMLKNSHFKKIIKSIYILFILTNLFAIKKHTTNF